MSEGIKIYHVETQEDYDDLMIELEKQGYVWFSGSYPTSVNYWISSREETVIYLNENAFYTMTRGFMSALKNNHPDRNIIKHKAKRSESNGKSSSATIRG